MADEKNLFNKNTNEDEKIIVDNEEKDFFASEPDSDFVDFSSAFNGEDERNIDVKENKAQESISDKQSAFKGFSLFRRKKEKKHVDKYKGKKEDVGEPLFVEEKIEEVKLEVEEKQEEAELKLEAIPLEIQEEPEPKPVAIPLAIQEEPEPKAVEIPVEVQEDSEPKPVAIPLAIQEEPEPKPVVIPVEVQGEPEPKPVEISLAIQEEPELKAEETPVESQKKPAKEKKFMGFSFFKKKSKETESSVEENKTEEILEEQPVSEETPVETIEEVKEPVESAEAVVDSSDEEQSQEETAENIEEETEDVSEEFEEIPPFEETEEATQEETVDENNAEASEEVTETAEEEKAEGEEESTDEQDEKPAVAAMTVRDHLTFILIILALLLTIIFVVVKFIPLGNGGSQDSGATVQAKEKVAGIQVKREKADGHFIQSDMDDLFYVYSSEYKPTFYQCNGKKMSKVNETKPLNVIVEIGNEKISAKVDYVEIDGKIFGTGVFRKTDSQNNYLNDMIVFKLVNLPKGYEQNGKALLLATNNSEAASKRCSMWNDSYIVDLEAGYATRFLTSDNSVYSSAYSILTDEGYVSVSGNIPFFSSRDYDVTTNKRDIYIKSQGKETRFATNVAGSFVYADGNAVSYLKVTDKGFNVVRKENGKENVIFSLDNNTSYLYHNEFLLDKYNGNLYNVKTGEKTVVTGYGMSNPEMMTVSPDGKYLVVVGAVNSAIDYQVHIFDLTTGNCAKYVDDNFSEHENLAFVNDTTFIYSAVEPKQGYEYVMLDVSKAF